MRRTLIPILAAFLIAAACSSVEPPDYQGGGAVMNVPRPEAMRAEGWLEFADLSLRTIDDQAQPVEPYVRGFILGGAFEPTGDVQGVMDGPAARREVAKGWLELRSRSFFAFDSPRAPMVPYVEGYRDLESGAFYPTSTVRGESPAPPVAAP